MAVASVGDLVQPRIRGQSFAGLALRQWKGTLCFKCVSVACKEQTNGRVSSERLLPPSSACKHVAFCCRFWFSNKYYTTEVEENIKNQFVINNFL